MLVIFCYTVIPLLKDGHLKALKGGAGLMDTIRNLGELQQVYFNVAM